ncbi:hypothetical protein V5O48_014610 [Marasmius crinis-equi]|uniref:Uncharacterized protein n=1 Tax=Marasmius crinis-equi TaxID=585013 RepID=A0ABR3EX53_9AGAR
MTPSYQRILDPPPYQQNRQKARLFPSSIILLILWVAFVAALLGLLEGAVRLGPQSDVRPFLYWSIATLAGILRTVFAQAHVPVTGMYLARVAVSALQNPRSTPNSWSELFWLADREWMGPMGIIKITLQTLRCRIPRASLTFILFGTTCTTALLTPVFLTRAYQVQQITIIRNTSISAKTIHGDQIDKFPRLSIQAAAMGPWAMNTSLSDMYFTSLYTASSQLFHYTDDQPQDFFFANEVGFANATIPGLHMNGSCVSMSPNDIRAAGLAVDTMATNTSQALAQFCKSRFQGDSIDLPEVTNYVLSVGDSPLHPSFHLSLESCNNATNLGNYDDKDPFQTQNVGYFYYKYTLRQDQRPEVGLVQCLSNMTTGTAHVSGLDGTYAHFHPKTLYTSDSTQSNATLKALDPMMLTFGGMDRDNTTGYSFQDGLIFAGLGFTYVDVENGDQKVAAPSSDDIARKLWSAIVHSVAAIGVLSKDFTEPLEAIGGIPVAVLTRSWPGAMCTYVLLALWLGLIALIGGREWGYRKTFSPELDSYVAAELISRERWLLEDVPIGEAEDNQRLKTPFRALGIYKESTQAGQMVFESEKLRLKRREAGGY